MQLGLFEAWTDVLSPRLKTHTLASSNTIYHLIKFDTDWLKKKHFYVFLYEFLVLETGKSHREPNLANTVAEQ